MTSTKTVKDALTELSNPPDGKTRADWMREIFGELPPDLPAPVMSNEGSTWALGGISPGAVLSFSRSYGDDWNSVDVLAQLEQSGFQPLPASLVKWNDYRRSVYPGRAMDVPETQGTRLVYTLSDAEPIAPLWIIPQQHTPCEASTFYRSPSGLIHRVTVPGPSGAMVLAERANTKGGWHYKPGTARLRFPDSWHSLHTLTNDGERIASISAHSGAWVDTSQGISGAIYFSPDIEQDEWPLAPSEILRQLTAR